MKKTMLPLLLALCLALLLTACGEKPAPTPDPVTDPVTEPDNTPIDPDVKKYFEYFQNPYNNADIFLLYTKADKRKPPIAVPPMYW